MSKTQFSELIHWLRKQNKQNPDGPKFIVSSSIIFPRKLRASENSHMASALRSDAWDGFPYSFHRLLGEITDNEIQNVLFLSGDEHLSCIARAVLRKLPDGKPIVVHSIHSSALYAPFPFANSVPGDFAAAENFKFNIPGEAIQYECSIFTEFAYGGDGFAILHVEETNGLWSAKVQFHQRDRRQDYSYDPEIRKFVKIESKN
jgi:phosphodiesterase/alkaline phosphatase D-like protein